MAALAEVQVLANSLVNKQPSLAHLELQPTPSAHRDKLALHVLIDYQLHAKS
jgi:hypothetical protein